MRIIDNPYTAGDPRRAAWDEGFCAASGSDGMDIPEAWRRKSKKGAKGDDKRDGGATAEPSAAPESAVDPDQDPLPFGDPQDPAAPADPDDHSGTFEEPAPDAPWAAPLADPAPQPEGDAAKRLDDLVKRTKRRQADTAAEKAAAKSAPKGATKRSAKAPAKGRKGDGEGQP